MALELSITIMLLLQVVRDRDAQAPSATCGGKDVWNGLRHPTVRPLEELHCFHSPRFQLDQGASGLISTGGHCIHTPTLRPRPLPSATWQFCSSVGPICDSNWIVFIHHETHCWDTKSGQVLPGTLVQVATID